MKIMICSSMTFAKEILDAQKRLSLMGHSVSIPCDTVLHFENPDLIDDLNTDREHLTENNILKRCFDLLAASDAVIFLNYPKNGVDGYVGTSSLMEMGLAYYLSKKIYLLFKPPSPQEARWVHEVLSFQPVILNGNIEFLRKQE